MKTNTPAPVAGVEPKKKKSAKKPASAVTVETMVAPLLTLSDLPRHLAMGVGMYRGVPLFVSRGIGYSGLHIRIGSPAEVALLTLRSPHGRRAGG